MKPRELSDNIIEASEATPPEAVDLLQRFAVGECWERPFNIQGDPNNTSAMTKYIEKLKESGLDIGKGDTQFGYRMPPPENDKSARILQIFRRR